MAGPIRCVRAHGLVTRGRGLDRSNVDRSIQTIAILNGKWPSRRSAFETCSIVTGRQCMVRRHCIVDESAAVVEDTWLAMSGRMGGCGLHQWPRDTFIPHRTRCATMPCTRVKCAVHSGHVVPHRPPPLPPLTHAPSCSAHTCTGNVLVWAVSE